MTSSPAFPIARYRFECVVESSMHLPEYAGSTLRGAFGNALRRTACMTREKDCKACPLYRTCPYPAIFQPPPPVEHALQRFSEIPAPFIVEPPAWGEREYEAGESFDFHLVLIGKALAQLPLVVYAWQRALAHGIGKGEGTARLEGVYLVDQADEIPILNAEDGRLQDHTPDMAAQWSHRGFKGGDITLHLQTPLRLQHNGRPVRPAEITARDLLMALVRRVALLGEFHAGCRLDLDFHALAEAASGVASDKQLAWRDWTRYSSRQKQEMTLGGCIGRWTLTGVPGAFHPFLHAGQWLHVGKNATFGLGHYRVDV